MTSGSSGRYVKSRKNKIKTSKPPNRPEQTSVSPASNEILSVDEIRRHRKKEKRHDAILVS